MNHVSVGYPETGTVPAVSEVSGLRFPDPYRWLEENTPEVRRWQREQARLASETVSKGQDMAAVRRLMWEYEAGSRPDLPQFAAGRWFRVEETPARDGAVLVIAEAPFGEGRPLVALSDLVEAGETAVLSWLAPAPDGGVVALGICTDGSEHNRIRLIDADTGRVRDDAPGQILHSAWAGGVSWWPDSRGFSFFALTGAPHEFRQAVFSHRLGPDGGTEIEPVPVPAGSREYTRVQYSDDGRWAVASHRLGSPIPIAVRDLTRPGARWRPFITDCAGTVAGRIVGDRYLAVTDVDAPRGRVVAIPLGLGDPAAVPAPVQDPDSGTGGDPNDPASWTELVPESDVVLRSLTPVGEHLYLSGFDRTAASVRVLDRAGVHVGTVPLPGDGAIGAPFFALTALAQPASGAEFLFSFSTLTTSWGVYRHRPGAAAIEVVVPPAIELAADVEMGAATATDGTPIPFHIVRAAGNGGDDPAPVLISAYGAANVPLLPQYQPDLAAFVASGGVLVQAYLRGGGEFGSDWFRGAHRERRHVRDSDLVAVAEHLIESGVTAPHRLALTGGSDGGLMCGVAVTRRPELWRAVLPRSPLLDLVGGLRDPYLEFVIRKAWADPDDPEQVRRLAENSPYELVAPGRFPLVYVQAGDTDPRCPPWQARKFVARLQAAQTGEAPILLHVFENAGHGAATSPEVIVEQDAEWLACLLGALELPAISPRT